MITIKNVGARAWVQIDTGIGFTASFHLDRNEEMDAKLLINQLNKMLELKIQTIRKDAYELGWKDKQGKKNRKKTWFNASIQSDFVG